MADTPVYVEAMTRDGMFELRVANSGSPIPPAIIEKVFEPFVRASVQSHQQGLGLGLHIASEIARAHGGTLTATSTQEETSFVLRMPSC